MSRQDTPIFVQGRFCKKLSKYKNKAKATTSSRS